MPVKVSDKLERVFAQAVSLDQSGRLKNMVFVNGSEAFILNHDNTVALRFKMSADEACFQEPLSFFASDYEGTHLEEEGGRIVFVTRKGEFTRRKSCAVPDAILEDVTGIFQRIKHGAGSFELSAKIVELLDPDLSHVEFHHDGQSGLSLIQRNIYNGTVIEIKQHNDKTIGFQLNTAKGAPAPMNWPVGIRTGDLIALFAFNENLRMYYGQGLGYLYVLGRDPRLPMDGAVALCQYDELINITKAGE
jgi:hypothetical protein